MFIFVEPKLNPPADESFDRLDDWMTANMDPCYKVSSKFPNGLWLLPFIIWLAPWAGKMNQIACCNWLPAGARWSYLALLETTCYIPQEKFPRKPYKSFIVQSRWLDSGLVLFGKLMDLDLVSVHTCKHTQKKNLANIQPSWPHTCSVTHMSFP